MSSTFSCSTMWNIRSHNNASDALKEIKEIGFDAVELNYLVTDNMLNQMKEYIDNGNIKVSSIHNVMPRSDNEDYGTDSPLLGYLDEAKREIAIDLTKRTIDNAYRFNASAVVLHVSQLPLDVSFDKNFKQLVKDGKRDSEEYDRLLATYYDQYKKYAVDVLEKTIHSLEVLSDYIEKKQYKIRLGIENRAMIHQIPTLDELETMLPRLKGTPCGLWYDIGHGILMDTLKICSFYPNLNTFFSKLVGVHIHDAIGVDDHFYPYKFGDNFDKYLPLIQASPIKVFEVGPKNSRDEVKKSLSILREKCENK